MIAECIIFLATFSSLEVPNDEYFIDQYFNCREEVPMKMWKHADYYYEFFEEENLDKAIRIGWCESRGKTTAHRTDNKDSGVMQFVPWTWNWVAEEYDLPRWDTWVVLRYGRPYTSTTSKSDIGFTFSKVQFTQYYNIMFASLLAEDIYGKTQWKDWSSSQFCWGNEDVWKRKWGYEEKINTSR
tara:strand:+ start:141 stop:692 length:552 start_codon:yes stop_codon:yes gene_type:complete